MQCLWVLCLNVRTLPFCLLNDIRTCDYYVAVCVAFSSPLGNSESSCENCLDMSLTNGVFPPGAFTSVEALNITPIFIPRNDQQFFKYAHTYLVTLCASTMHVDSSAASPTLKGHRLFFLMKKIKQIGVEIVKGLVEIAEVLVVSPLLISVLIELCAPTLLKNY